MRPAAADSHPLALRVVLSVSCPAEIPLRSPARPCECHKVVCSTSPAYQGSQVVTLSNVHGGARGDPRWPRVPGTSLSVSSISHGNVSLAGGLTLALGGAGFSFQDTAVTVCNETCAVESVADAVVSCVVLPKLLHSDALVKLNLTANTTGQNEFVIFDVPSPPPPTADQAFHGGVRTDTLIRRGVRP